MTKLMCSNKFSKLMIVSGSPITHTLISLTHVWQQDPPLPLLSSSVPWGMSHVCQYSLTTRRTLQGTVCKTIHSSNLKLTHSVSLSSAAARLCLPNRQLYQQKTAHVLGPQSQGFHFLLGSFYCFRLFFLSQVSLHSVLLKFRWARGRSVEHVDNCVDLSHLQSLLCSQITKLRGQLQGGGMSAFSPWQCTGNILLELVGVVCNSFLIQRCYNWTNIKIESSKACVKMLMMQINYLP